MAKTGATWTEPLSNLPCSARVLDFPAVLGEIARDDLEAEPGQDRAGWFPVEQEGERRPDQFLRRGRLEPEVGFDPARYRHDVAGLRLAVADLTVKFPSDWRATRTVGSVGTLPTVAGSGQRATGDD